MLGKHVLIPQAAYQLESLMLAVSDSCCALQIWYCQESVLSKTVKGRSSM